MEKAYFLLFFAALFRTAKKRCPAAVAESIPLLGCSGKWDYSSLSLFSSPFATGCVKTTLRSSLRTSILVLTQKRRWHAETSDTHLQTHTMFSLSSKTKVTHFLSVNRIEHYMQIGMEPI